MGLLTEYFAAPSDGTAAAAIDDSPSRAGCPVVDDWRIEPVVRPANPAELLRARSYEVIVTGGDWVTADRNGGEQLSCRVCV